MRCRVNSIFLLAFFVSVISLLSGCNRADSNLSAFQTPELHVPNSPMPESFYHAPSDELKANFKRPPDAVKPWVYWYWVNDHISKDGIKHDLQAMKDAGISTALIGIIHLKPSIGGYGEVEALSEQWWQHLRFAIEQAADYGIDIGLFNSPGWSQSGGPWVDLSQSMRYLDSAEYQLKKGELLRLKQPDGFYQDVKVIAFKTPTQEQSRLTVNNTAISVSESNTSELSYLIDGNKQSVYSVPANLVNSAQSLVFDFELNEPLTARTLEVFPHNVFSANATLYAINDNNEPKEIESFLLRRPRDKAAIGPDHDAPIVIDFPAVTAKSFRLELTQIKQNRFGKGQVPGIKELVLSSAYKLERFVEKKLAKVHPTPQPKFDSYQWPTPVNQDHASLAIAKQDVIDISEFVEGARINWQPPEGQWTVVHYFMRTTGTTNGPSSKQARGPEVDKLNKQLAQFHFDAYLGKVLQTMRPEQRTALKYVVVDSYEQGAQNWTDDFSELFIKRYGYDPIGYLPVFTGRIVNSAQQSERFLWDVRRLVADSVSYEYAAGLRERAHQHGLKLWLENYGHWGFPGEFLQYGGQADIVSGEFWASGNLGAIELKAASSAAHIYGHKTVMSESFTAGRSDSFINHPWNFKKRGDWSFVEGINHTLLHVYIQQAYDDKYPGVNAWFGSEFNRNNTWFGYMDSWLDYVKRCNYMLQQGHYVADVMYFIGEDTPKMTGEIKPAVPKGYSYDFINAEVILKGLSVQDGMFVLPSGMKFKLLVLPDLASMRPEVLTKIKQLVADGGAIYGPKPTHSPSLKNFPNADQQLKKMADTMWQHLDGINTTKVSFGQGQIFYSANIGLNDDAVLETVLTELGQPQDLSGLPESVIWSHRSSDTHEIYFIANQTNTAVNINPSFRQNESMGQPQIWNAVTGKTYKTGAYQVQSQRVRVPHELQGLESVFVVFAKQPEGKKDQQSPLPIKAIYKHAKYAPTGEKIWLPAALDDDNLVTLDVAKRGDYSVEYDNDVRQKFSVVDISNPIQLNNAWQLNFTANRDVPTQLELPTLVSLTELTTPALQHYSGEVLYQTEFALEAHHLTGDQRWVLELGEVGVIARVSVNGVDFGELWSRPMAVDVTHALKQGQNKLKVQVATTWANRLVGDLNYPNKFPGSDLTKQFSTEITFASKINKHTPLQRSGLMGPVQLKPIRQVKL